MYIVFPFLSVGCVMLAEGAEVTGARLNSSISFYNNGNLTAWDLPQSSNNSLGSTVSQGR